MTRRKVTKMGQVKTGVGRIIWGHPSRGQQRKDDNDQVVMKDGQPVIQWVFGVAFPKAEFQAMVWPEMHGEAVKLYPGGNFPQDFAWKYKDGDTALDKNGKPLREKEGYAGCYVWTISTEAFAPPVFKWDGRQYVQLDEKGIKTGDYVLIALNIVGHGANGKKKAGLYMNPLAIEHVGYGAEIFNGPDAMQLFGGQQYQLPQGASATPVAPTTGAGMPGTGTAPGMMQQPMQPGGMMQPAPMQQPQQPQQMMQPGMMPGMMGR